MSLATKVGILLLGLSTVGGVGERKTQTYTVELSSQSTEITGQIDKAHGVDLKLKGSYRVSENGDSLYADLYVHPKIRFIGGLFGENIFIRGALTPQINPIAVASTDIKTKVILSETQPGSRTYTLPSPLTNIYSVLFDENTGILEFRAIREGRTYDMKGIFSGELPVNDK